MAGIRAAIDGLITLEEALAITSPVTITGSGSTGPVRGYKYPPKPKTALAQVSFIHSWAFPTQEDAIQQEVHRYTIAPQCLVKDADLDQGFDIASAFWEAFLNAWVADQKLTSSVISSAIRSSDPTIAALDFNGVTYPGFTCFIDCWISRT